MRNLFLTLTSVVLVTAGLQAQDKKQVTGSGNLITREVAVSSFDQLNVQGVFNLVLSQGSREEVKIEAEDNLQDLFEIKNDGSKLVVTMKKDVNFKNKKDLKVYITFKKLVNMELKTVGNVSSSENLAFDDLKMSNKSVGNVDLKMTARSLDVDNKSVGNVRLNGKADNAVIKNKGVGNVQAGSFVVQNLDIENTGVGNAEVNAAKELKVKDSFLGKVSNKGAAAARRMNKVEI